jgi:D-xylose transport system permease protein
MSTNSAGNTAIGSGHEGNVKEQISGYLLKIKSGDMGSLPAMLGLVILAILFTAMSPVFLTALNFANLFNQAATLIVLAMGLVFVLVLAEIDLSAGVTAGVSAAILVISLHNNVNWILSILIAIVAGVVIGYFIGVIVARVGIPSFVVTLACFLAFQGLQLLIIGNGGLYRIENSQVLAIQNSNLTLLQGWIFYAVGILLFIYSGFAARRRRSRNNQPNRPMVFLYAKIAFAVVAGAGVVAALNLERSSNKDFPIHGVPIVIPVVIVLFVLGTFVLDRTKFGRHVYAVGGNPEAARRAGIKVTGVKIAVFTICSTTAAISGIISASRVGSVDASMGRTIVLNGVAAAVVGGVSLFGGKGRLSQAVIGGFVIAIIDNGLGLMGYNSGINLLITGAVLLLAASADAISRKRGSVVKR